MSSLRQTELFAGQDWKVLYQAFTTVNFNASDPQSLTKAMREYIQTNFPEDFNDWIASSEYVAIIELLGWICGNLAFKTDINARENFMETAAARESILRLARFLSYNPSRNQAARGLVKLVEVSTDDDILDASGINLAGARIAWDDPDDAEWFDRFTLIINSALVPTNPFGVPLKRATLSNIRTQLYRLNCRLGDNPLNFNARVGGTGMPFEIVNADFDEDVGHYEREPDPDAALHLLYRADGSGNSSRSTGFFLMFKQGSLNQQTYSINAPIENRVIDLDTAGINETDVWVQSIDDNGALSKRWTKVPTVFSQNITFNAIPAATRDIYSVITRDDDRISIRFSDGVFGTAPVGNIRIWHRVSNGRQYQIRPAEIDRVSIPIRFYNRRGVLRTITLTFSLQDSVNNAAARETDENVKQRASAVYATQERMVSGEDYNSFPLSSNLATKLKALVRTYSGHSRHIDLEDPTGTYQDADVYSDDGIIFKERADLYQEIPFSLNRTPDEILTLAIIPMLESVETIEYARSIGMARAMDDTDPNHPSLPLGTSWTQASAARFSASGSLSNAGQYLKAGATLYFTYPDGKKEWVGIASIVGDPTIPPPTGSDIRGPIMLAAPVPTGSIVTAILPFYTPILGTSASTFAKAKIDSNTSFTLWFDPASSSWAVRAPESLSVDVPEPAGSAAFKVVSVEYAGGELWRLSARGSRLVFESVRKIKWFTQNDKTIDSETGASKEDIIRVLRMNSDLEHVDGRGLGKDFSFSLDKLYFYPDGHAEPRRTSINFSDFDDDGIADDPDAFERIISSDIKQSLLFWKYDTTDSALGRFVPYRGVRVYETELDRLASVPPYSGLVAFQLDPSIPGKGTFWVWTGLFWDLRTRDYSAAIGRGPNTATEWVSTGGTVTTNPEGSSIGFHWKHYAPNDHRIDMAMSNFIDMFVLSSSYDFETRQWIANGAILADLPTPPSELDLRLSFREYEKSKMFSDETIWRPAKYKFLFGPGADEGLRAKFKIVRLPNSAYSEGEIRSRVVRAINEFFEVSRWDFGETFYFTELSAFIHQRLATVIGSCVIVPMSQNASFGDGFEVQSRSDEIFISTAQIDDVVIIQSNTPGSLRIR